MTDEQVLVLKAIVANHKEQMNDMSSHYWDATGGTYSFYIADKCGLDPTAVEADAQVLAGLGYIELLDRGNPDMPFKGLRALQAGIDQVNQIEADEQQAQADADAQAEEDAANQNAVDVINRAANLGILEATAVNQETLVKKLKPILPK